MSTFYIVDIIMSNFPFTKVMSAEFIKIYYETYFTVTVIANDLNYFPSTITCVKCLLDFKMTVGAIFIINFGETGNKRGGASEHIKNPI